jgi:arylsulfatase A-like enzyme
MGSGMSREDIKKKLKHRAGKFGDLRVFVDDLQQRSAETLSKVLSDRAIGWREQLKKDEVQNPQAVTIWNGRHHKLAADEHNKEALAYEFFERALAEARKVKPVEPERPTPPPSRAGQSPAKIVKTPR